MESRASTGSELVADLLLSISRQSLDKALLMTQSQWSRPPRRPVSATGSDLPLSLNTLKLFEAAASLQGPIQAEGQRKSSLPKPILQDHQDSSPSGSAHSLESRAEGQGVRSGGPNVPQSGLVHPGSWGGALRQDPKSQDSICGLVTPKHPVNVTDAQAAARSRLPVPTSVRKSVPHRRLQLLNPPNARG